MIKYLLQILFISLIAYSNIYSQWTEFSVPGASACISAVDDNIVYVGGHNIHKTLNGGLNWIDCGRNGVESGFNTLNIYAIDQQNVLIAGYKSVPFQQCHAYKTSDGGASWTMVFYQSGGWINGIGMKDANNGIMVGDPIGGIWNILVTTNAGVNWTAGGTTNALPGEEGMINSFYSRGNSVWFGTIQTSSIYHSSNFGSTWSRQILPSSAGTYCINFSDPMIGITGGPGNINYTTNSGTNWIAMPWASGGFAPFGVFGNTSFWLVCKREGQVFKTSNLGLNWVLEFVPSDGSLREHTTASRTGFRIWDINHNSKIRRRDGPLNVQHVNLNVPKKFNLEQNYPNPFNPQTNIMFAIVKETNARLSVYDAAGKLAAELVNGMLQAGSYEYKFNGSELPSGVYFYKLDTEDFSEVKKMVLIK